MSAPLVTTPNQHPDLHRPVDPQRLRRALALRDLTDPAAGPHAVQQVVDRIVTALTRGPEGPLPRLVRGPRVVSVRDHYDRLGYPADAVARDARYSRYVDDTTMLRAHTSAHVPGLLDELAREATGPLDVLLVVPGICYRRDSIDRRHVAEPHQLDLWRIRVGGAPLGEPDLVGMVDAAVGAVLPLPARRTPPSPHPYTLAGREILVGVDGGWVEVGECGLAHPQVLAAAGLPAGTTGLAMGLGLDRLTMLVKGIEDIRLLRSDDPRVAEQMVDLRPYRPVSRMPAVRRDLSIAVAPGLDDETVGDRVRDALGAGGAADVDAVEELTVLARTPGDGLPEPARHRMGLRPGQENLLLRLVLRHPTRTLTDVEANAVRDRVYLALHEGSRAELATGPG
jgi:phenylalanyl-tRNA synthetase alpha chain